MPKVEQSINDLKKEFHDFFSDAIVVATQEKAEAKRYYVNNYGYKGLCDYWDYESKNVQINRFNKVLNMLDSTETGIDSCALIAQIMSILEDEGFIPTPSRIREIREAWLEEKTELQEKIRKDLHVQAEYMRCSDKSP
jgi:hypothetical protein